MSRCVHTKTCVVGWRKQVAGFSSGLKLNATRGKGGGGTDGLGSATTGGRRADAGHPRRTRTPTDTPGGGGDRPLVILLARRPPRDSRVERHHHLPSGPTRSRVHAFTRSRAHALTRARAHARAHAFTLPLFLPVLGPPDGHHEDSSLSPPNQKRQPPPNQPDTICFELQR